VFLFDVFGRTLDADELGRYLADLFHEQASPAHPGVRRLR